MISFLGFGEIISALKMSMTRDTGWFAKRSAERSGSTVAQWNLDEK